MVSGLSLKDGVDIGNYCLLPSPDAVYHNIRERCSLLPIRRLLLPHFSWYCFSVYRFPYHRFPMYLYAMILITMGRIPSPRPAACEPLRHASAMHIRRPGLLVGGQYTRVRAPMSDL